MAGTHRELASQADFIVSAVTASQTVAVAESCAPAVGRNAFFLDFNSASPRAKPAFDIQQDVVMMEIPVE